MKGYDNLALNHQIELDLTLEEMTGALVFCRSKQDIVATLNGLPTWQQFVNGLQYLDFDPANPDWLEVPAAATGLNFTAGDFSLAVWARIDDAVTRTLMCRGLANTDGWMLHVSNTGRVGLATFQAGATQTTYSTIAIAAATFYLIGITRIDTAVRTYVNGEDVTDAPDTHVDPLTSARDLHIGILDNEVNDPWDGGMHRPRAWSRLLAPAEMRLLYDMDKDKFP